MCRDAVTSMVMQPYSDRCWDVVAREKKKKGRRKECSNMSTHFLCNEINE